jgi:hypothetical protein
MRRDRPENQHETTAHKWAGIRMAVAVRGKTNGTQGIKRKGGT